MPRGRIFRACITGSEAERADKLDVYKEKVKWLVGRDVTAVDDRATDTELIFGYKNPRYLDATKDSVPDGETVQIVKTNTYALVKSCSEPSGANRATYTYGPVPTFSNKKISEGNIILGKACEAANFDEAMDIVEEENLEYYIGRGMKISKYFEKYFDQGDAGLYRPEEFNLPPFQFPKNKTLIFVGPTFSSGQQLGRVGRFAGTTHDRAE